MKILTNKKYNELLNNKEYIIGNFETDDLNDMGVAGYWYKQCTWLEEKNLNLWRENNRLIEENMRLKKEISLHSRKLEITEFYIKYKS